MNIGSLFMTLGFNVDDKKAKEFKDGIVSLRNELFKVSGIAAGAAYAVNRFVSGSAREAVSMKNLADQTGLATDEMQRFYKAASAVNSEITFDNAIGTLRQLEDTIAQINFGEGPIGSAAFLGVRINQDTDSMDVIRQLRENLQKNIINLGDVRTIQEMSALGIGREYLQFLRLSNEELEKLNSLPIVSDENLQKLNEYAKATKELANEWRVFKADLAADIGMPFIETIGDMIDRLRIYIAEFKAVTAPESLREEMPNLSQIQEKGITETLKEDGVLTALKSYPEAFMVAVKGLKQYITGYNQREEIISGKERGNILIDEIPIFTKNSTTSNYQEILNNPYRFSENEKVIYNKNTTNNNTFNTQSMANPEEVARMVVEGLSELEAKSDLDNFPRGAIPELR